MKTITHAALLLVLLAQSAHAQDLQRASEHFERGLAFFGEGRFDAALAEFNQAYEIAPAPQTLYNIARVQAALGHAVEATAAYERYLREPDLPAPRRREAEAALAEQRARVGTMRLTSNVDGATVNVDGTDVGTTPMNSAVPLTAGTHALELRATGYESIRISISIAGREELSLELTMRTALDRRGMLRVISTIANVEITVDGQSAGRTPLASTIPLVAGAHTVRASRAGYRTQERQVAIEDGAEMELRFDLVRDANASEVGMLRLRLPEGPHLLRVDGEAIAGTEVTLPAGPHEVEIEMSERRPFHDTIEVPPDDEIEVTPPLEWTLDARRDRVNGAAAQQLNGGILTLTGAGVATLSIALLIWNETQIAATDSRLVVINQMLMPGGCTTTCDALREEGARLSSMQDVQTALRIVTIGGAVIGASLVALGLPIWLSAPSAAGVDQQAHAMLRIGPGSLHWQPEPIERHSRIRVTRATLSSIGARKGRLEAIAASRSNLRGNTSDRGARAKRGARRGQSA
jgi:hypothetical protein